ncbi:hypothetical protein FHW36_11835 [Chitinophaga polysaccharea]|uniref:Uncharacterized protein n=1 Tax=Chitinophaga polysaccharea TaxID=1293035 RepID=A0A561P0T4_9BACT|nr:DUF5712 family protein [Chitinophaga polysaccharea]TWF31741.1 hypothetical protein FHW36_11835 [Chitinophaga polysaccharea]
MFVKVHKASKTPAANNKGSCNTLAQYLEKENIGKAPSDKVPFFNHQYDSVAKGTAVAAIDNNNRHLTRKDNKFFMISINPTHREMQHLIQRETGLKNVNDFSQLNTAQQGKVFSAMREYTRSVMDIYARNFNRPNVQSGKDLVYFAKVETMRKWKPWEMAVKEGRAKAGQLKDGLNVHVHVVVSRNDKTQTTKLSPESRSRGGKQQLNGKAVEQGFNHEKFKVDCGDKFNSMFKYNSVDKESYRGKQGEMGIGAGVIPDPGSITKKAARAAVNKMLQGSFNTERQVVGNIITAAKILTNPSSAIDVVKQKLLSIIKGASTGAEL